MVFLFIILMWWIMLFEQPFIHRINHTWLWCFIFYVYFWNQFINLLRCLCICSWEIFATSFFCNLLVSSEEQNYTGIIKYSKSVLSSSIFQSKIVIILLFFFFKCKAEFTNETIWCWSFLCGRRYGIKILK